MDTKGGNGKVEQTQKKTYFIHLISETSLGGVAVDEMAKWYKRFLLIQQNTELIQVSVVAFRHGERKR